VAAAAEETHVTVTSETSSTGRNGLQNINSSKRDRGERQSP